MKTIIYITDFIEGKSNIASVRYEGLMSILRKRYNIVVVNNKKYGDQNSIYSAKNFKFDTMTTKYENLWTTKKEKKISNIEKLIRKCKPFMTAWRNICRSQIIFNIKNKNMYKHLLDYIYKNNIYKIIATVPDIHVLYIAKMLKNKFPSIPLIVEVRDILNSNIGDANPTKARKKAEKIMLQNADGIIALTDGIRNYYTKESKPIYKNKIKTITNGYNEEDFLDTYSKKIDINKKYIKIVHIGSIYAGRNIKDFIFGLIKLSRALSIDIEFDLVGFLDGKAIEDIESLKKDVQLSKVKINIIGTKNHKEAIDYLNKADIAAILTHREGSFYAIPGKVFEYIGSRTPIIAVTKDLELIKIVHGKYGECADHDSEDIKNKILKIINTEYDFSDRKIYSRQIQANKIEEFLEYI